MKAFEEWDVRCDVTCDCGPMSCDECTKIRKVTWKAALEWVLEGMHKIDEETGEEEYWMGNHIEEELKDE